jgi:PEP-CTERM motif
MRWRCLKLLGNAALVTILWVAGARAGDDGPPPPPPPQDQPVPGSGFSGVPGGGDTGEDPWGGEWVWSRGGTAANPRYFWRYSTTYNSTINGDDFEVTFTGPAGSTTTIDLSHSLLDPSDWRMSTSDHGTTFTAVGFIQKGQEFFVDIGFLTDATLTGANTAFSATWTYAPFAYDAPEPSTWMLCLVGFAGLGLAGYGLRRKGKASAA